MISSDIALQISCSTAQTKIFVRQRLLNLPFSFILLFLLFAWATTSSREMTAGHSLGEFSALGCCRVHLSFEDGLKLVYARAMGYAESFEATPSTMLLLSIAG